MRILAVNCGSSSLKCSLLDTAGEAPLFTVQVEDVGGSRSALVSKSATRKDVSAPDHAAAMQLVLAELERVCAGHPPDAVAHRIVHGGASFTRPVEVTGEILARLRELDPLAPLHNPPALAALEVARARLEVPHVAVFDTAFHATLPPRAREYALPREITDRGVRRYGFHGISHEHVMRVAAEFLERPAQDLRIVSCHLGNGASVCAIEYGRSIETSMGMTPLEGLVMGTRAGDVDPGIVLHLLRETGHDVARVDDVLNRESGLQGLTGTRDLREIETRAAAGDETCRRALAIYAHRVRKYIGAYAAVMGGVDVIAFTGGIGENSKLVRNRVLQRLDFLGVRADENDSIPDVSRPVTLISEDGSRVAVLVVRADEEAAMARAAVALLSARTAQSAAPDRRVPVGISARHVHLTTATIGQLFGEGHTLTPRTELSQHGQFAAQEVVTLIGPRGRIDNVRVMGPPRAANQVEISRSDEFTLGIDAPVRISGDLANTPGITLEGPKGRVKIDHGVVCARRHIHMSTKDAARLGIPDHANVAVRIDSDGRDLTFNDVAVRVSPDYVLELHLDTDEANAAGVTRGMTGEILV